MLNKSEIIYIAEHASVMTDQEIAVYLDRDIKTIGRHRRSLGIEKTASGMVIKKDLHTDQLINKAKKLHELTDGEKKVWFENQLKNSRSYPLLRQQLTRDEIGFYVEEFSILCVQFEDVAITETRQIDELVKAEVLDHRILRNIKYTEDAIELLAKQIETFRKKHDMTDEENQQRDDIMLNMVKQMAAQSNQMTSDHLRNVELRNKLLQDLSARRRDRVDEIDKSKNTFLGLVKAFEDEKVRESQGRHAELVRLAKDKKLDEWRGENIFPDGSRDSIILDDQAVLQQKSTKALKDLIHDQESEPIAEASSNGDDA